MFSQFIVNGIVAGSLYSLVAIGFGLVYATGRFFNFAHGAIYTVAAYLALGLMAFTGSLPVAAIGAVAGAIGLVAVLNQIVYRRLWLVRASASGRAIASLGLFVVVQNVLSLVCGDAAHTLWNGPITEGVPVGGARITHLQVLTLAVSWTALLICWWIIARTRLGKVMRAVASNDQFAGVLGIHLDRVYLMASILGSALAAVAAVLSALQTDIRPNMGYQALLMGIFTVVVGGIGSIPGAALGGFFIGLVQHAAGAILPGEWHETVVFAIFLVFLFARPQGLLGTEARR